VEFIELVAFSFIKISFGGEKLNFYVEL